MLFIAETIGQNLEKMAKERPLDEALIFPALNLRYTWAQLNTEVDELARGMMALGIQKNDRVAIWATNLPNWLTVMYAASKIGAVTVTVNTFYRQAEIKYLLEQSEANYLFLMESFRNYSYVDALYAIAPEIAQTGTSPELPNLRKVIHLGEKKFQGLLNYTDVLELAHETPQADYTLRKESLAPDEIINMQYTSGTTGFPKGVMLTHQSILTNAYWIGEHQKLTAKDIGCVPVPFFHCFGLVLCTLAYLLRGGTMVVVENNFTPQSILEVLEKEKCTAIYGVPSMFITILENQSLLAKHDLSSLRTGIMAGSPCPIKTMQEVIDQMNASEITICYGLTETSPVVAQTTTDDNLLKRTETVGRPMPGVDIKIVDAETGVELPLGEIGEVAIRGYVTMCGYYKMPNETAQIIDENGWLYSGDLGKFDEDGYLVITGRKKDMIIRAGENIYPMEVEEYLRHMPGVIDAQVVAVPSFIFGEELGAFLLTQEDAAHLSAKEVKAYLRPLISSYKIPRYVKVLDKYPLTASGKVQKFKLREMAQELWPKKQGRS